MPDLRLHDLLKRPHDPAHAAFNPGLKHAVINPALALHPKEQAIDEKRDDRQSDQSEENVEAEGKMRHGNSLKISCVLRPRLLSPVYCPWWMSPRRLQFHSVCVLRSFVPSWRIVEP